MNRLIIIGNGFDIAHGLKTRFSDFILYYLSKVWTSLHSTGIYKNEKDSILKVEGALDYFKENDLKFNKESALSIFEKILKEGVYRNNEPRLIINSRFFRSAFNNLMDYNWLDIEIEYYNELVRIIEDSEQLYNRVLNRLKSQKNKLERIQKLNNEIDFLQNLLKEYLKTQEEWFRNNKIINDDLRECFYENIYYQEDNKIEKKDYKIKPEKTLIVNFNYTSIAGSYLWNSASYLHIHGSLSDEIIFGFGDDTSDKYKELENEYNNEFLRKIKSFKYLKNSNYKKLLTFINSGEFQVHIYGHSCGVSDRTLFKQIFENKYCKHIKTFYYDQKDFDEKMFEISRHFENKNMFLEKVVSFNDCRPMPQPKEEK